MKKVVLFIALTLALSATVSYAQADPRPDAADIPLRCSGSGVVERPTWQRILTLGILGKQTTETFAATVDIQQLRIADLEKGFVALRQTFADKIEKLGIVSFDEYCQLPDEDAVLRVSYDRENGLTTRILN